MILAGHLDCGQRYVHMVVFPGYVQACSSLVSLSHLSLSMERVKSKKMGFSG